MLASRADVYTIRCSCKQWPCTYTAPCVARTCWEESQTHIAAPLWQRRSTHPARTLMHAANVPRRGKSCTDQQHHTPPQHRQQNAQHHPHTYDQTARRHPGHTQHTPTQPDRRPHCPLHPYSAGEISHRSGKERTTSTTTAPHPTRAGPHWKPTADPAGSSSNHAHDQTAPHQQADRPTLPPSLLWPPVDTARHV